MNEAVLTELFDYAVKIRRTIHRHPEVGFDLPVTTALVKRELLAMGITPDERYGVCSLAADLGQGERCIALRADMDALPVEENADVPFRSEIPGKMHACGHDSHTAALLAVAKYLKTHEEELSCRVRLIFQPSEEGAVSGAKMMADRGVMEGVTEVLCAHCEQELEVGRIGIHAGDYQAACIPATIRFFGRSAHAALPHRGIDAVAMAVDAYVRMKAKVAELAEDRRYIWNVGHFSGGEVHNVIPDLCTMDISFRFYDLEFAARVEKEIKAICEDAAKKLGGRVEFDWHMSAGPVYNDPALCEGFIAAQKAAGTDVCEIPGRLSSEDFCWFLEKTPGFIFRFGTRNEETGCTSVAHTSEFCMDERGIRSAIRAFIAYVMQRR